MLIQKQTNKQTALHDTSCGADNVHFVTVTAYFTRLYNPEHQGLNFQLRSGFESKLTMCKLMGTHRV